MVISVVVIRGGVNIFSMPASSGTIAFAINEIRQHDIDVTGIYGLNILDTDKIELKIDRDTYGPFDILQITRSEEELVWTTRLTLVSCLDVLRSVSIPGNDPFINSTNIGVFTQLTQFVLDESGVTVPITIVNADSIIMDSKFAVNGSNALDLLRSLCGATGNSFRADTGCGIEIGTFGDDSGWIIRNHGNRVARNVAFLSGASVLIDDSEVYGALYSEGGSFTKKHNWGDPDEKGESVNLQMGSYFITSFVISAPVGYEITNTIIAGKTYYKMVKTGSPIKRTKKIQIGGIIPKSENSLTDEISAAKLLASVTAKYLGAKSQTVYTVDGTVHDYMSGLRVGDKVSALINSTDYRKGSLVIPPGHNTVVLEQDLYVKEISYVVSGDYIQTKLLLSSQLSDPEELLSSKIAKTGESGYKPYQQFGQTAVVLVATAEVGASSCNYGAGRQVHISYAVYGFTTTPTITVIPGFGYSGVVLSANATDAVICLSSTVTWVNPVTFRVGLSGSVT